MKGPDYGYSVVRCSFLEDEGEPGELTAMRTFAEEVQAMFRQRAVQGFMLVHTSNLVVQRADPRCISGFFMQSFVFSRLKDVVEGKAESADADPQTVMSFRPMIEAKQLSDGDEEDEKG